MKKCAFIIPVRNRLTLTRSCLERLREIGVMDWATVVVVDDHSDDGTPDMITREFPEAVLLRGTGSLWWTGAIRMGMDRALSEEAVEAVFWLNDDCLPARGSPEMLRDYAMKRTAVCGGVCYSPGTGEVTFSGGFARRGSITRLNSFGREEIPCDWLEGNMVCFPREICERIGFPEAHRLPQSYGDIDYTLRAREAGYPVVVLTGAKAENARQVPSYAQSWADKSTSLFEVWANLLNPRFYRYVPGMLYFEPRHFGIRGWLNAAGFFVKLILLTVFRPFLPQGWLFKMRRWVRRRRGVERG